MRLTSQSELTKRPTGQEAGDEREPEASAAPASLFPGRCGPHYATEAAYKAAQYELRCPGLVKGLARPAPGSVMVSGECGCLVTPALSLMGETPPLKIGGQELDWLSDLLFDSGVFFAEARRAAMEGDEEEAERLWIIAQRRMRESIRRVEAVHLDLFP